MTAGSVVTTVDGGGVRLVGIARPEVHNALNDPVVKGLVDALRDRPEGTQCLVVYGHGPSFCAGGDRREGMADADGETAAVLDGLQEITRQLQSPDVLTIAAVEGWAIGGGAELAIACDIVIAGEDASFFFPEVKLGAHATGGSTWLLSRTVGLHRAKLLMLTGLPLSGPQARDWGIVAEVVPQGSTLERARTVANDIVQFPAGSLTSLKRSMQAALTGTLEEALDNEVLEVQPRLAEGGFLGAGSGSTTA